MAVDAVIFDWGGTLTPWHDIDLAELWLSVCMPHFSSPGAAAAAAALHESERQLWQAAAEHHQSATISRVFEAAGVESTQALLDSYLQAWEPHTLTDAAAAPLLEFLRGAGIKVGVLSNTMWPRQWHEAVFRRDGVLHLIDGAVYTSEIDWTKPHPEAFAAAMGCLGITDPARCVFVGDRPYDDVHGARSVGMRAILIPNSTVPAFSAAMPDAVIEGLAELRPLIERW